MGSVAKGNDVEAVAAAWVIRLDRGDVSEAERAELEAWLEADSRRMGAFVRAQAIWTDADRVAALDPGKGAGQSVDQHSAFRALTSPRQWLLAASIAALIGVAALISLGVAFGYFSGREVTALGEIRRITLDDGSSIVLNTSSVVQVEYEKSERRVVLRRGEASFHVAHDTLRPFIVQARDVAVKAVGTSFSVRLQPTTVSVTVAEGVVEVMRPAENSVEEVRVLGRNRQVTAPRAYPMSAAELTDRQLSNRLAWQEGLLVFDGERLAQAVAEVNRYSPLPVVLDSAALADRGFVGVFRVGDSRAFADAAAAAFHAHVDEKEDGLHLGE
jgi:transmembrane sensor